MLNPNPLSGIKTMIDKFTMLKTPIMEPFMLRVSLFQARRLDHLWSTFNEVSKGHNSAEFVSPSVILDPPLPSRPDKKGHYCNKEEYALLCKERDKPKAISYSPFIHHPNSPNPTFADPNVT